MDGHNNLPGEATPDVSSELPQNQQTENTLISSFENKFEPLTNEQLAATFMGPVENSIKEEETQTIQAEPIVSGNESPIVSAPPKSHKSLFAIVACSVMVVAGVATAIVMNLGQKKSEPTVTISDLTEKQKKKLGIDTDGEKKAESSEIENKNNYSDNYKKYLELSDEEKAELDVIPRKEEIPDEVIDEIKEDTDDEVVSSLPEKFDLRDVIDITVGYQGNTGRCWDYASSTALETYLKLRGVDYNPSESQIDFLSSNLMYGDRKYMEDGGSFSIFANMASSIGTMSEDALSNLGISPDNSFSEAIKNYDYFKLAKNDDPVYVTKTVNFPSVTKYEGEVDGKTEKELKEFRDLVKAHIMTNGALYTAVAGPWTWDISRYCEKPGTGCFVNHAMAIIGWDDNYPKENFAKVDSEGNRINGTPKHDGAYLVLNSYGKDWDGSGAQDGVFYISYDEYAIESELSGIASTSLDDAKRLDSITSEAVKKLIKEKLSFYIIEKDGVEYITDYALNQVTNLDLSSRGLTDNDLKSVAETFPNLSLITISDNNISDLSSLAGLKNINTILFSNNNVEDISALCELDRTLMLGLRYNKIKDISCLEGKLGDYAYLDISGNNGITGFGKLTSLTSLTADNIGLESLEPLSSLHNLQSLSVRDNNIKSLAGLSIDEWLDTLDLSGNKGLIDLTFNKPVQTLIIEDANLTDISILNNIEADNVVASGNGFKDLSGFNNDKVLQLDLSSNKNLTNLSVLSKVESLILSDCGISSLSEVGDISGVRTLILSNNNITSLEGIEKFPNLTSLDLENNKLTSLKGIEKLKNLQNLDVTNNQISSLSEVSKLSELNSFSADNNNISNADALTSLEKLYFASLSNNNLTSVPNFAIQEDIYLTFEKNPIKNAVIPKSTAMINLNDCNVKTIDYSSAERLIVIYLKGNPDWNEYGNLVSKSMLGQKNMGRSAPFLNIMTDYSFSEEELDELNNIPNLPKDASWFIDLKEYTKKVKKTSDGVVDLEKNPSVRTDFMYLLGVNTSLNGFTLDKAATKLILEDKTASSITIEQWRKINKSRNISTNKIVYDFK